MKLRHDRKAQRQSEAQARQASYDKLSPKEKLARLDKKLGKGQGAKKQRERLMAEMSWLTHRMWYDTYIIREEIMGKTIRRRDKKTKRGWGSKNPRKDYQDFRNHRQRDHE